MPTINPSDRFPLPGRNEVHVWSVVVAEFIPYLASLERLLSVAEKQRAARFFRQEDRFRYVIAHGILRQLLGHYLSVAPAGLEFIHNDHGKPALLREEGQPALSFNLAHSGEVIVFALAVDHQVGVDIELVRHDFDVMALAQSQFSEREIKVLEPITNKAEQTEAFFRCWTRKEAYLKARGEGLGFSLKQFAVSFALHESAAVLWAADDPLAAERWSVLDLAVLAGYAGAVVCEGRAVQCLSRRWVATS